MRVRWPSAVLAAALVVGLLLTSCGGSVGSGGTGAPLASAQGTVTGFGSVVVDGVVYDDDGVAGREEIAPGQFRTRSVALGQQVELAYEQQVDRAVLRSISVAASLVGPVQRVGEARQVMGQTIEAIDDPVQGPLTVLEGMGSLDDLAEGDWVEVHAAPWRSGGGYRWRATRVEKLDGPAQARVAGTVTQVGPGRQARVGTLTIDYGQASMVPADHVLRPGDRLIAWGAAQPDGLRASAVRVLARESANAARPARLSGVVGALDATSARFELAGVTVDYGGARILPPGEALIEGRYAQVEGHQRADGVFVAREVKLRKPEAGGKRERVHLRGRIERYASDASFEVRGTAVDASGAQLRHCEAGLGEGLEVRVQGWREAGTPVRAEWVDCRD